MDERDAFKRTMQDTTLALETVRKDRDYVESQRDYADARVWSLELRVEALMNERVVDCRNPQRAEKAEEERDAIKRAMQDVVTTLGSVEARAKALEVDCQADLAVLRLHARTDKARLAELVRRVKAWTELRSYEAITTEVDLRAIISDYEVKP